MWCIKIRSMRHTFFTFGMIRNTTSKALNFPLKFIRDNFVCSWKKVKNGNYCFLIKNDQPLKTLFDHSYTNPIYFLSSVIMSHLNPKSGQVLKHNTFLFFLVVYLHMLFYCMCLREKDGENRQQTGSVSQIWTCEAFCYIWDMRVHIEGLFGSVGGLML